MTEPAAAPHRLPVSDPGRPSDSPTASELIAGGIHGGEARLAAIAVSYGGERPYQHDGAAARLAALTAHELNTPLQAICNLLFLAEHDPDGSADHIAQARAEVGRLSLFLGRLLAFARPEVDELTDFSCHDLCERVLALMGTTLTRHLAISRDLAPGLPTIRGRPTRLARLLFDLFAEVGEHSRGAIIAIAAYPCDTPQGRAVRLTLTDLPGRPVEDHVPAAIAAPPPGGRREDLLDIALCPGFLAGEGGRLTLRRSEQGTAIALVLPVG